MAHFGAGAQHPVEELHPEILLRNARSGLFLFVIYLTFYVAFVLLNAFWPAVMAMPVMGVSLAVVYGMGLLGLALLLALIYCWHCRARKVADGRGAAS